MEVEVEVEVDVAVAVEVEVEVEVEVVVVVVVVVVGMFLPNKSHVTGYARCLGDFRIDGILRPDVKLLLTISR